MQREAISAVAIVGGIMCLIVGLFGAAMPWFPGKWLGNVCLVLGFAALAVAWRFRYKG